MSVTWAEPAAWPALGNGVHVWRSPLAPGEAVLARFRASLSPEERRRADRFVFARDREAFTAARGALREILGRYLGLPAAEVPITTTPEGKPVVAGGEPICFNVSHAGAWALVAVSRERAVGVDLEPIRPLSELPGMIPMVFDAAEAAQLQAMPLPDRLVAFLHGWTRKEAMVKAFGEGLSFGLTRLGVSWTGEAVWHTLDGAPAPVEAWSLVDLGFEGHAAALMAAGPRPEVGCWAFRP